MSDKPQTVVEFSEDRIQQSIFLFLNNTFCLEHHISRGIVFHVPNQRISKVERMKLKSIGVLAGVSDLVFIFRGRTLYLEVKTPKGSQSDDQKEFQARIEANGFRYYVVRSVDDARDVITREFIQTGLIQDRDLIAVINKITYI